MTHRLSTLTEGTLTAPVEASALVAAGGCAVWLISADQAGVPRACRLTVQTLRGLGLGEDVVDAARLVVSELCDNAVRHVRGLRRDGRPVPDLIELRLWRRGRGVGSEVIGGVVDAGDGPRPDQRRVTGAAGFGARRGLRVVADSAGRCGYAPTRFVTRPQAVGTVAWFAFPAPELSAAAGWGPFEPADAIWAVATELRRRGIPRLTVAVSEQAALLKVNATDLTGQQVSFHSDAFCCEPGCTAQADTYGAHDITHLVEMLVQHYEAARHRPVAHRPGFRQVKAVAAR